MGTMEAENLRNIRGPKCNSPRVHSEAVQTFIGTIIVYDCILCENRFTFMTPAASNIPPKTPPHKLAGKKGFRWVES